MAQQSTTFTVLIWVIPLALFYFLLLRPQQQQQKKRRDMLSSLDKGDRVVTIGGIHGTITDMDEKIVTLRIAEKVEIKVNRSGIGSVLKSDS
ncbi:MAG: preprotein translocase subunit YajC [Firmicutes bacterium]|nr:preprotein translocase subunit YajC [Bacillota bacterium]